MSKKISVLLAIGVLLLSNLACKLVTGGTSVAPSLKNLRTAYDSDGNNPTMVFAPSDIFYVVGDLEDAPAGTIVDAKWKAAQVDGFDPDELIYEQNLSDFTEDSFSGTIYFQLSNDSGWPVGQYKVEIYLNDNLVQSVPFSVQ